MLLACAPQAAAVCLATASNDIQKSCGAGGKSVWTGKKHLITLFPSPVLWQKIIYGSLPLLHLVVYRDTDGFSVAEVGDKLCGCT